MAAYPLPIKPESDKIASTNGGPLEIADARGILHDLTNHLTVIDLWVFQLRATVNPLMLAGLERSAEGALDAAKRLAPVINAAAAKRA